MRIAPLAGALAAVLLLAGCASRAAEPGSTAPSGASSPSASTTPAPLDSPLPATLPSAAAATLTVRHGGAPAIPGPSWTLGTAHPGASAVTVIWAGSTVAACGAVDEAVVTETATQVVIALGEHARLTGRVCPLVLVPQSATVTLSAPLGSRRLLEPRLRACPQGVRSNTPGNGEAERTCEVRSAP